MFVAPLLQLEMDETIAQSIESKQVKPWHKPIIPHTSSACAAWLKITPSTACDGRAYDSAHAYNRCDTRGNGPVLQSTANHQNTMRVRAREDAYLRSRAVLFTPYAIRCSCSFWKERHVRRSPHETPQHHQPTIKLYLALYSCASVSS